MCCDHKCTFIQCMHVEDSPQETENAVNVSQSQQVLDDEFSVGIELVSYTIIQMQ